MAHSIFINLAISDLKRSMEFYAGIGCVNIPEYTDDTAAAMQWNEHVVIMIMLRERFSSFSTRVVNDPAVSTSVLNAVPAQSIEACNTLHDLAVSHGGSTLRPPDDYGFMYSRSFSDPDGHIWEVFWMNPEAGNTSNS